MTKVSIEYKGKNLVGLTIKGHAGAGAYGHDLVCAATSAAPSCGWRRAMISA